MIPIRLYQSRSKRTSMSRARARDTGSTGLRAGGVVIAFLSIMSLRGGSPPLSVNRPVQSMDVLPVFLLQQVGKHQEYRQEDEDVNADLVAHQPGRFAEIGQEIRQIAHGAVVRLLVHAADALQLKALELHNAVGYLLEHGAPIALP